MKIDTLRYIREILYDRQSFLKSISGEEDLISDDYIDFDEGMVIWEKNLKIDLELVDINNAIKDFEDYLIKQNIDLNIKEEFFQKNCDDKNLEWID